MNPNPWPKEMLGRLVELNDAGLSRGKIAQELSTPRRTITRNAVIGMCYRMGLKPPDTAPSRQDDEALLQAMQAIEEDGMTRIAASRAYGVSDQVIRACFRETRADA